MKFCWVTLTVRDLAISAAFYRDLVGLKEARRMSVSPDLEIVFLGEGETQVELIWNRQAPAVAFGQNISLGFAVDSLERLLPLLAAKGIAVHSGPFQPNPGIRFLYVLDPDGLKVQFVEHRAG
ncbi:MAG: glyoxalase [Spirochaetes bacterium GWD1_61_31]|nr:MAG: glyoxalase [Spirochaetes bacterium GWB1_60_80]OHD33895.1 MAG: glyoxalase [Spirochaetes bacterium GWC1_61_12]OHD43832.1 MAG: glyoxalase [Spirochaetes bacterium GWD1_61_31]OHD46075.1 MAG: glyoxalase [Spirochaetes bacterium GWE1_60_18]OHD60647.1 MAG: glyoxalase [Spirochaetes bacterium GWF1_60_12]HAP44265.1 glyoxalase [Spirochaetaceae bacterium]